jgi:dolichol-phosphate mannosyltransferase
VVILPTYNEAENLTEVVQQVLTHEAFDILVVDDDSPDGTGDIAEWLTRGRPGHMATLHGRRKRGLGPAYLQGFDYALAAGYDHIFQMDADLSHDPTYLPAMRRLLDEADVVLGSRYVPGGGAECWPLWRRAISRSGSAYSAQVLGLPYRDLTSGFKGFRRRALAAIDLGSIRSRGFAFQIEVTYRCAQQGFRIVEMPIVFKDRLAGRSKMDWRIVTEALTVVWSLRSSPSRL